MTTQRGKRRKPWARRKPLGARELALQILVAIESRGAYSDRLLESRLHDSQLAPEDAHLVTALVQGTLRHRAAVDHQLAFFARQNWNGLPAWIQGALRMGAFQILFLDRIPARAAVDESVELAKKYGHPGTAGLVNAILRKLAQGERAPLPDPGADPEGFLAIRYSHPRWIVDRWAARFGSEETERLLAADNEEPLVSVRPNLARATAEEVRDLLREEGFTVEPARNGGPVWIMGGGFVPSRSRAFREGLISLQDEAEATVVSILDPQLGERVLDLCGAPGGKGAQIAERVGPRGRLIALERHRSRAKALRSNLVERLRLGNVDVVQGDGTLPPVRGPFSRILVDAPCSGLGVLRRRADARWRKEESSILTMAALQPRLLGAAAPLIGARGVLVYSVCSLEPEETEAVVESLLKGHPELELESVERYVPAPFRGSSPYFRATPQRNGTDGVFAARFVKR